MNITFNDAVLTKNMVTKEINRVYLLVVNENHDVLITTKDSRITLPFFDENESNELIDINVLNNLDPFITIQDYQYHYPLKKGLRPNYLLNARCYIVNKDEVNKNNCEFAKLFEINHAIDQHRDKYYHHYDDRILKTILEAYFKEISYIFYNPNYYKNYLESYYYYSSDNTQYAKERRKYYVNNFVGMTIIKDICEESYDFINNLVDNINIINDEYATISLKSVNGLNNGNKDWYADILGTYEDKMGCEKTLSLYILRCILGNDYKVYLTNETEEYKDDNGNVIGTYIGFPEFYIKGDINKLLDITLQEQNNKKLILNKYNNE